MEREFFVSDLDEFLKGVLFLVRHVGHCIVLSGPRCFEAYAIGVREAFKVQFEKDEQLMMHSELEKHVAQLKSTGTSIEVFATPIG